MSGGITQFTVVPNTGRYGQVGVYVWSGWCVGMVRLVCRYGQAGV